MKYILGIRDIIVSWFLTACILWGSSIVMSSVWIASFQDALIIASMLTVITIVLSIFSSASLMVAVIVFFLNVLAIGVIASIYEGFSIESSIHTLIFTAIIVLIQIITGTKRG